MPPRRSSAVKENGSNNRTSATSTPKRATRSYHSRMKNSVPENDTVPQDEPSVQGQAGDTAQAGSSGGEGVLDEIVVSKTPRKTNTESANSSNQQAVIDSSAETPRRLRLSSRTSSFSQSGSPGFSPSGRGVTIRKQDFSVGIAADDDGEPDELSSPPAPKKQKATTPAKPRVTFRKSRSKWDNPDEMLTDCNAPLVKAKLRELLCSPKAWDILSPEERKSILAKFPDDAEILDPGTPDARPDIAALRNNDNFRHDVARYQDGLAKGFHDPEWIRQAQAAHRSRQLGLYDEFMAADFEEKWDMPMPKPSRAVSEASGNSSRLTGSASDGQANGTMSPSKKRVSFDDVADQRSGTEGPPKRQCTGIPPEKSIEVNAQGWGDSPKRTNGDETMPAGVKSDPEVEKRDQLVEGDAEQAHHEQAKPAQGEMEAMCTQDSPERSGQHLKDRSQDATAPRVPSSEPMEGGETQREAKSCGIPAADRVDGEDAGKPTGATVNADSITDEGPQHLDANTASTENKAERQPSETRET